ncbi:hypothetical protein JCM3770_001026 [Rhodotorula araucariae]
MTDYMTHLPAELFLTICELAYEPGGTYLGLVSRAFLPIARRLAFRKVTVTRYTHLAKLCDLLSASNHVGDFVEDLLIDLEFDEDQGLPKAAKLSSLFHQLVRLETLAIKCSSRLAKFALAPKSSLSLPALELLVIEDPLEGWANPFDPRNYRNLVHYSELYALELTIPRAPDTIGRYRGSNQPGCFRGLALRGHLHNNPAIHDLISSQVFLGGLFLRDDTEAGEATLSPLLQSLHNAEYLDTLSLEQTADDPAPLVQELARFPNLVVLEFRHGTYTTAMLPLLQGLKQLEELYFFDGTRIAIADLRSLIAGPARAHKLKIVHLNMLVFDDVYEHRYGWTSDFTKIGVVQLLDLARGAGVKLSGPAAELARDFARHAEVCAGCRAMVEVAKV